MVPMSMTNSEVIIANLQKQNKDLTDALREVVEWLDNAPLDYSNGVEAFGVDEGNVRGWKAHKEMVNKFKQLLGIPVSDVERYIENMNKLPDDDFPF